ncbi:hypothetical protein HRW14_13015 [Streptomyces lunaelactis]|uniref:hypothetical protein n=1 Tax=Streptomyces lunaelactis TaxID=1535768 RepID=UPI0015849586|nr:hypothetical protein [Streptomyces lunaelactis]NUK04623.1 hypothetical protein [Streptomyces lunaelactis]NUK14860.1 hypothetical protein [Streptomyces lunaelactis]NUK37762.1 hypothetical protein [Streptomyces lunaelactis]NUK44568.1 hypothetical protein [Streptomyces lunaelactis]NUK51178.1 hypothetical protein [Streptomyces lunaelactis]
MHMNSAPHLLTEDRAEYERILDDALRNAHDRPDLAAVGQRLNAEQLRTMALNAAALITTAAAAEYEHYVKVREELRTPRPAASVRNSVLAPAVDEADESGAGFAAVIAVLAPVLAGTAAVIFLLVGYILKMLSPTPSFADSLLTAGWFFGAVTAAGILVAAAGLLITALRNGATQVPAEEAAGEPDEVARAKEAWRHAVLERGLLPFLRAALADPSADPTSAAPPRHVSHLPKIGYSGPDYSSPSEGSTAGQRPTFTSPDFTSPDFGGPEHQPE